MTRRPLRWLLVAQDDWGLGHVSRHIGLGRAIRRSRPEDEILVLTSSEAGYLFWREGLPTFKLPGPKRANTRTVAALGNESQVWLTRAGVTACLDAFRPHVVVADTYPAGVRGEFHALLNAQALRCFIAQENRYLGSPATQRDIGRYHLVLVLHGPAGTRLPLPTGPRTEWVGHILVRRRDEALSRRDARQKLRLPEEGAVCLVGFGGGGNPGYDALARWAASVCRDHAGWTFAFCEAPLLWEQLDLPAAPNLRVIRHYPLAECLNAFDLAVMVNGSSVSELAHFDVPAIVMPNPHAVAGDEIPERAQRIAAQTGGVAIATWDSEALRAALHRFDDPANRRAARDKLQSWREERGGDGYEAADQAVAVMLESLQQLMARTRRDGGA